MVHALIDHRRQLAAHLVRRAARILAALGERLVAAGAAGADDLVLHLLLERRARDRTTCACWRRRPCRLRRQRRAARAAATSSSTATVVAAASAGSFASANANDRSGSSAMPVPSAMIAEAEPDPVDQRVDDELQRHRLIGEVEAAEHDVEILGRRAADRDLGRRLLLVPAEGPLRRIQAVDLLAVDEHRQVRRSSSASGRRRSRFTPLLLDRVLADRRLLPELQQHLLVAACARCRRSRRRSARCRRGRCSRRSGACSGRPDRRAR